MIKKGLLKKFEIFGIMTAIAVALAVNYIPVKANITPLLLNSENNKKEMEERPAMIGRLYIPDVGVNVALFDTTGMKYDIGQSYVDAEDSSAWKDKNGIGVVADHGDQTFKNIHKSVSNETMAYIQVEENIKTYAYVEAETLPQKVAESFDVVVTAIRQQEKEEASRVIRRVDDLGRIVLPREVRNLLGISDGTPMEINPKTA